LLLFYSLTLSSLRAARNLARVARSVVEPRNNTLSAKSASKHTTRFISFCKQPQHTRLNMRRFTFFSSSKSIWRERERERERRGEERRREEKRGERERRSDRVLLESCDFSIPKSGGCCNSQRSLSSSHTRTYHRFQQPPLIPEFACQLTSV